MEMPLSVRESILEELDTHRKAVMHHTQNAANNPANFDLGL